MHFQDVVRLRRVLQAQAEGGPVEPADVAAGLAALEREIAIKRAASERKRQNFERHGVTGHEWQGPWPSDRERA